MTIYNSYCNKIAETKAGFSVDGIAYFGMCFWPSPSPLCDQLIQITTLRKVGRSTPIDHPYTPYPTRP